MSSHSIPATQQRRLVHAARAALVLSLFSYVMLALAEQGDVGSEIAEVPQSPLPFERAGVIGLDLSRMSSAEAIEWLDDIEPGAIPLLVLPVDGDIVASLSDESRADSGAAALNTLLQSSPGDPLAVCFQRPISSQEPESMAESAIQFLQDNYSDRVAYISACGLENEQDWHETLANQLDIADDSSIENRLLPLSVGAAVRIEVLQNSNELDQARLRSFADSQYVIPVLESSQPAQSHVIDRARTALRNAAQVGLVLLQPASGTSPEDFVASMVDADLEQNVLPEGFTGTASQAARFDDSWQTTTIGTVAYRRASEPGAVMVVDFIGTGLHVIGLRSPEGGTVNVWVDRTPDSAESSPDNVVTFDAMQSHNDAVEVIQDLPNGEHRLTLVTGGGDVTVAGFFVSGSPGTGWNSGLAAIGLIIIATGSLAFLSLRRVRIIRTQSGPPAISDRERYPGEQARDC